MAARNMLLNKYVLVAALLLVAGVSTFALLRLTARPVAHAKPQVARVVTHSTNTPDEKKPAKDYRWQGAPNDPKKITVAGTAINNFVQNVGVDQRQEMAVPSNIHLAGWFVDSVRPGDKGLSIIDGHVDGRTRNDAVFSTLAQASQGGEVTVEFGGGAIKRFEIFAVHKVAVGKAHDLLFSQDPHVTSQLNLITCVGVFDKGAMRYDQRLIVSAKLAK